MDWAKLLMIALEYAPEIVVAIAGVIVPLIWKNNTDAKDAIKSVESAVRALWAEGHPALKAALADGEITKEEWATIAAAAGPLATTAATRGGRKVLERWAAKSPVMLKYIQAAIAGLAYDLKETPTGPTPGLGNGS